MVGILCCAASAMIRSRLVSKNGAAAPAHRYEHEHLALQEIGGKAGQTIIVAVCPAILDRDALAFDVAGIAQPLPKRLCRLGRVCRRPAAHESDHRHHRLLRAHREGPRRRAAEKRDEVAPLH